MPPGLPFLRTQLPLERLERRLRVLEVQAHVRLPPVVPPHDVVDVPEDRTSVGPPPPAGRLDRPHHPPHLPSPLLPPPPPPPPGATLPRARAAVGRGVTPYPAGSREVSPSITSRWVPGRRPV